MKHDRRADRIAITGASSGIGRAAALAFAANGARLVLAARSLPALVETADACKRAGAASGRSRRGRGPQDASSAPDVHVKECDVTRDDDVRALAIEAAEAWDGECDIVLANAGVGQYGAFLDARSEDVARVMDTNVMGVFHTVEHVARKIVDAARRRPGEIDLSVAALIGRPANAIAPRALAKALYRARTRGG